MEYGQRTFSAANAAAALPHSFSNPIGGVIPCRTKWNARIYRKAQKKERRPEESRELSVLKLLDY